MKMPICPECKAEIGHLHAICREENKYEVTLEEGFSGLSWGRAEPVESSCKSTNFNCPECGQTIFRTYTGLVSRRFVDEQIVIEFLRGDWRFCHA